MRDRRGVVATQAQPADLLPEFARPGDTLAAIWQSVSGAYAAIFRTASAMRRKSSGAIIKVAISNPTVSVSPATFIVDELVGPVRLPLRATS